MIDEFVIIRKNVKLGKNSLVETFCYIGISPSGENKPVHIGDNSKIRAGTYIYEDNMIGNNFQTGNKVNIRETNIIGDAVSIGTHSIIEHHVTIGDGVRIHSNVFIPEYTILKENAWIGPGVVFTNANYPKSKNVKNELQGPIIENSAIIGAGSIILPGITIGEQALVGSGSVVTKNVAPYEVVIGNPAKKYCRVSELSGNPYDL